MANLHLSPSRQAWRSLPLAAATLILIFLGLLFPFADTPLPEIPAFFPAFGTFVMVTEGLTAFLLIAQFSRTRLLSDGLLGAAYGFTAFIVIIQTIVYPGVLAPIGALGSTSQSVVWLWIVWHAGYPILVLASMTSHRFFGDNPVPEAYYRIASVAAIVIPAMVGWTVGWLSITHAEYLPSTIVGNNYQQMLDLPIVKIVWIVNMLAFCAVLFWGRGKSVMHQWLTVAVLGCLADTTLTLAGGSRYTLGWYGARFVSMASATAVLGALLWEVSQLYGAVQKANVQLSVWALKDGLTGLYNRRFLDVNLPPLITEAARSQGNVSILLLDIDYFKDYNDMLGHVEGDQCLKKVGKALESVELRTGDFVARYGGEEFVVVLRDASEEGALQIAERIRTSVESLALPSPSKRSATGIVTVSIGTASSLGKRIEPAKLIKAADKALYAAKAKGRNTVVSLAT